MARVSQAQIEDVRSRIDLAELIESYGHRVKRVGSRFVCCCPFHNEKTPSFSIDTAKGLYHCFGCGESGSVFTFVQKQEGLSYIEAVRKLASRAGVKLEEKEDPQARLRNRLFSLMTELSQFYHRCLVMKEATLAREYLVKRDLDEATQKDYVIGYAPKGMAIITQWAAKYKFTLDELEEAGVIKTPQGPGDKGYHRFGGRLMFSIADRQGRVVAFSGRQLVESKNSGKYVNSPETLIFNKSSVLFGFDKASKFIARARNREVIVCEGQIDCIRLHISGFPNAVASQGTAFTQTHARMLHRVADSALLCFDDDAAGHKATVRTAGILMAEGIAVRVASLPDGDDPDSFLRTKGADAFRRIIDEKAESVVSFQIRSERAKEAHPDSADALGRISKAVLETISQCSNAVVRAALLDEAAQLLKVPVFALAEEMGKLPRRTVVPAESPVADDEEDLPPSPDDTGESAAIDSIEMRDAGDIIPPTRLEQAMMGIMISNQDDEAVALVVRELLPPKIFGGDFARDFAASWLAHDLPAFEKSLGDLERKWYAEIESGAGKSEASEMEPAHQMQEIARSLWHDYLRRLRFNTDNAAAQLEYQIAAKSLVRMRWPDFKAFVKNFKEHA